ncbi:phage tail tape measure protein [Streptomyces sediminimaris]|uniref:phage tail tape measure protein n=1 Tax=Streptomyces sediminimaris TaxID=3383721 RepID=UPI003999E0D0
MARVNAQVNGTSKAMAAFHKTALLAGAGFAAMGVESIKMASKFDASMTLLHTQAGVAQDKMAGLKKGVLDLAGKVAQSPDSLAESLFHVESNFESMGISSSKALKLTETAAKGATVGHAGLVDVTNALTAAVASGIPGVKDFDQAMGVLNATVGVGDMKMQDLANAFSTGMLATVKGFGLSIQDVGAALAVFGDNNKRGAVAATDLRMAVQALARPAAGGADALKSIGLQTNTLAKDMQKGGLKLALEDLVDRMHKAGVSSKEQGQIITDAFGRKAGSGLNILVGQFDRLKSKYPALTEGANKFGSAWKDTQKTFAFQMKKLKGEFDSLMIKIGLKLIPVVMKFVKFLNDDFGKVAGPIATDALKALGTVGGAALDSLGVAFKILRPFLKEVGAGFQSLMEVAAPFASMFKGVAGAIFDAVIPHGASKKIVGPFEELRDVIRRNKGTLLEAARQMGDVFIVMAESAMRAMPIVISAFHLMASTVLSSLGMIIDGAASAFKWVPGIGPKLATAAKGFDDFKDSALRGLDKADAAAAHFAASAVPRLEHNRLKLDIRNWDEQIKTAKDQLGKVPASKRAELKARIADLQAKVNAAKAKLGELKDKTVSATARDHATRTLTSVARLLGSLDGRNATSYVTTVYRKFVESTNAPRFKASGGVITGGSGTHDDVPIMAMGGEFVVRKGPAQKHHALLEAINDDRLPKYARGGSVTKSERAARSHAWSDLTISHFGHMAGYRHSEFGSALSKPGSLSDLVNALNQWRTIIKKATHGRQEHSLLRALDSSGRRLLSWDKQLGKVEASLSKARDKLNSLKDAASQLASSVKSGILSSANITKSASAGGGSTHPTINTIMSQMAGDAAKAQGFSSLLATLKKRGVDKGLLQDIATAGLEGGGLETAQALAGASASQIKDLNKLRYQQVNAAGAAGKTAADAFYSTAIKAQEKTVKSLTHSQDRLKASMDKLTRSMEKMIERAFKGRAAGGIIGAASGGIRSNLTWVGEHGAELLDLPAGARVWSNPDSQRMAAPWASMLNTPRRGPSYGPGPAGQVGQVGPIVLNVHFGPHEFGQIWVDTGRKEVKTRGGLTATLGN